MDGLIELHNGVRLIDESQSLMEMRDPYMDIDQESVFEVPVAHHGLTRKPAVAGPSTMSMVVVTDRPVLPRPY